MHFVQNFAECILVSDISMSFIYSNLDLVCGQTEWHITQFRCTFKCAKHQKGRSKLVYQTIAKNGVEKKAFPLNCEDRTRRSQKDRQRQRDFICDVYGELFCSIAKSRPPNLIYHHLNNCTVFVSAFVCGVCLYI